ncbi:hypothetical protein EOL96_08350 [Candidatus Saccharibacteria bacterium]|nr:hypothetical protein [Candidatus Saccharibacteria bacterium]
MDTYKLTLKSNDLMVMSDDELLNYSLDLQQAANSEIQRQREVANRLLGYVAFKVSQRLASGTTE